MRALNVFLAIAVSLAIALALFEGGLRLLGFGPQPTLSRFDKDLGWSKTPGAEIVRSSREHTAHIKINSLGLREDEMRDPGKTSGRFRVLFLGDSFVLGYTVEREDLFVDVLERWWRAEERTVECINGGTEGWSTDQEVLWFQKFGRDYMPDLVVLCPYENDLFWNGEASYLRFPKPRFQPDGTLERRTLFDPGAESATKRWAITRLFGAHEREPEFEPAPGVFERSEWACYFKEPPAFMTDAYARTKGALTALQRDVEGRGSRLVVAPIPSRECIDEDARAERVRTIARTGWLSTLRRKLRGQTAPEALAPEHWSPDEPVDRVLALCAELEIDTIDARVALKAAAAQTGPLYYAGDFHFNPAGNRAFAKVLKDEFDLRGTFPAPFAARTVLPAPAAAPTPLWRGWMTTFVVLWAVLTFVYTRTYAKDSFVRALVTCGAMLALVFTIALGGGWLVSQLPHELAPLVGIVFVLAIVTFLLVKLGRRIGTAVELLWAFTCRGHWYLMPLVVVLLTVGSLLVVAASSPLVAPFIYTLF
jgi:hypothetical protein